MPVEHVELTRCLRRERQVRSISCQGFEGAAMLKSKDSITWCRPGRLHLKYQSSFRSAAWVGAKWRAVSNSRPLQGNFGMSSIQRSTGMAPFVVKPGAQVQERPSLPESASTTCNKVSRPRRKPWMDAAESLEMPAKRSWYFSICTSKPAKPELPLQGQGQA